MAPAEVLDGDGEDPDAGKLDGGDEGSIIKLHREQGSEVRGRQWLGVIRRFGRGGRGWERRQRKRKGPWMGKIEVKVEIWLIWGRKRGIGRRETEESSETVGQNRGWTRQILHTMCMLASDVRAAYQFPKKRVPQRKKENFF